MAACVRAALPPEVARAFIANPSSENDDERPVDILDITANRIAENREIAGVHFQSDSDAGRELAEKIFKLLSAPGDTRVNDGVTRFHAIVAEARKEWEGFVAISQPDKSKAKDETPRKD